MADVSTSLKNWSTTAGSNGPAGSDTIGTNGNEQFQYIQVAMRYALATHGTVASATTCDIGAVEAHSMDVTGTTTITGFGTVSAGIQKKLHFTGALTLTHNATSLILPTEANITTVAGDTCEMRSLGSGNWKCLWYTRQDGRAVSTSQTFGDGSVSAPSMTFTSDTNTGRYRIGADNMADTVGGAKLLDYAANLLTVYDGSLRLDANGGSRQLNLFNGTTGITATNNASYNVNQWLILNNTGGSFIPNPGGTASGSTEIAGPTGTTAGGNLTLNGGGATSAANGGDVSIGVRGHYNVSRMDGGQAHWYENSAAGSPTINSGGGTGPTITGSDNAFRINLGTSPGTTAIVIDFAATWTSAPIAVAQYQNSHIALTVTTTTTQMTITPAASMAASGGIITVFVRGLE